MTVLQQLKIIEQQLKVWAVRPYTGTAKAAIMFLLERRRIITKGV